MPDLESQIRGARPDWPVPPDALEDRILRAAGLSGPAARALTPSGWVNRGLRSRRVRLILVGAVLAGSGAALAVALVGRGGTEAPGARASLAFDPAEVVGDLPGYDTSLDAAVDGAGRTAVVWTRGGRVVVSTRPAGGAWSTAVRLSDPARRAAYPRIGVDGSGRFTVIWREQLLGREVSRDFTLPDGSAAGTLEGRVGTRWRIASRTTTPGAGWGEVEEVSEPTQALRAVYRPQLEVSRSGVATAVFAVDGAAWSARRSPGGDWAREKIGATPGSAVDLRLEGDRRSGATIVTWQARVIDPRTGPQWRAWVSVGGASGSWSAPHQLGAAGIGKRLAASAIARDGTAVVGWVDGAFVATVRDPSGAWSPATRALAPPSTEAQVNDPPAVGVDGRGVPALVGVYYRVEPFPGGYSSTPLTPRLVRWGNGSWGAPREIGGSPLSLAIVPDAAGGLVVSSSARNARVRLIAPDGTVGGETTVRLGGASPSRLAVGDDGTSVLVGLRQVRTRDGFEVVASVAPGGGEP
ncbi:hypothetical protein [Miltoncostaea oceani]|uniref:hypothetical protein n=1 Tax=Miltoncostaea oceani TaxID=2843216 RepID=UPI001C3DCB72|nr:hypothetical protein [Miltoncostaea oceani]